MATTEKTPIWLDLKKEYIDDNFAKLQSYLRDCDEKGGKDTFYATTIMLFRERIGDLLRDLSERPIYADEQERQQLASNVNMLATYLLADSDDAMTLNAYVAFMTELRQMNPRLSDLIVKTIMQRIRHEKVTNLGFTWGDLEKIGTDLFVHNACNHAQFDIPLKKPLALSKYGTALLSKDGLMLTHEDKQGARKLLKEGANSLDTGIGITLRTLSGEKLKLSLSNSVAIIVDKLGVDEAEVKPEASFTNDLGADSLDTVELIMEFEKEVGISIPDDKAEKIGTVGDAIAYIEENAK